MMSQDISMVPEIKQQPHNWLQVYRTNVQGICFGIFLMPQECTAK